MHPEHAGQPFQRDGQVGVAEAAQDGAVAGAVDAQGRVLGDESGQGGGEPVVVGLA